MNIKNVYILEGKADKASKTVYGKQILYISQKDSLNLKTEFYNKNGKKTKELIVIKWKKYGSHWAVDKAIMRDLTNLSETEIEFLSRDTSKRPPARLFTLTNIERGR